MNGARHPARFAVPDSIRDRRGIRPEGTRHG